MFAKLSHGYSCGYHCLNIDAISWVSNRHRMFRHLMLDTSSGWRGRLCWPITTSFTYVGFQFGSLGRSQRAKQDALYAVFLGCGPVFHSLPLMYPAFSILIEIENLQQITTRNTAVFPQLSPHESARSCYLAFFDSWHSFVLSSQGTVNSTIITYFGYTDHRNISGWRFERVTSLRKCYVHSKVWYITGCYLLSCLFCCSLSH